jgi:aspartate/methionine/tyrosine aminotransferase
VIFPDPGFPIYESMIRFAGAKAVGCPIRESNGFALDPQDVISRLTEKTKLVILNSPANPTGGVTGRTQLEEVLAALRNRPDVWILSDEIYSRLLYDGAEHVSPLSDPSIRDRVILLDGFSKTWAMTGWRIGFGVMRQDLCEAITKLMINSNSCTASFTQRAAIEALQGDQSDVEKMHAKFDKRRKHIVGLLNEIPGFSCHLPKGAFYVMPNIRELGMTAKELQDRLLLEAGVAALAGTAFGAEGEGYLRFSYATDIPTIEKGLGRVREFVEAL